METFEWTVIGAGPAGICALAKLINLRVEPSQIIWIDPEFEVGDFGTKLSRGSSIPSNTKVENFKRVNEAIYKSVPACSPIKSEKLDFAINKLDEEGHCALRLAAEPMQNITIRLRKLVSSIKGMVLNVQRLGKVWQLEIQVGVNIKTIFSKKVILATGARPKALSFPRPYEQIVSINPYVAFVESELKTYLEQTSSLKTVAVIGSSHSAALSVMNLRKAGVPVKQFMNKPYRFATSKTSASGVNFVQFDNTGLKGEVADYIKELIQFSNSHEESRDEGYLSLDSSSFPEQLQGCSHAIVSIGFEPSPTMKVNGQCLSFLNYNKLTTEVFENKGLFVLGIAFPRIVQSLSGEIEGAVGYSKFWNTVNALEVVSAWCN